MSRYRIWTPNYAMTCVSRLGRCNSGLESPLFTLPTIKRILAGPGDGLVFGIRPEHITVSDDQGVPAELIATDYLGADTIMNARIGEQTVRITVPGRYIIGRSHQARLTWSDDAVHIFDGKSGKRRNYPAA